MGVTQSYTQEEDDGLTLSKPIPIQTPSSFHTGSLLDKRVFTSTNSPSIENYVPVAFRWTGRGRKVFLETWPLDENGPVVSGATNRVEMQFSQTERDFTSVLKLPPGRYKYHFEVDGVWRHAEDQPFFVDGMHISNTITVEQKEVTKSTPGTSSAPPQQEMISASPPGAYGGNLEADLSIICERALLNCRPIGNDHDQLPVPHRVMINHIYEQPTSSENDVVILGLTRRYKEKFVTTVYYKKAAR